MQELSAEIARLWDAYRRQGHPPAVPPVKDEWDRPRRGRKPAASAGVEHHVAWREDNGLAA
ncbi:MAG: hypothetical protein KGJ86_19905, partial [Chloroflexota bacterium]|nr:hypothetical protein [Chloroflexota bacterium]